MASVQETVDRFKAVSVADKPKADKKAKKAKAESSDGPLEVCLPPAMAMQLTWVQLDPQPDFIQHRVALFEKLRAEYDAQVAGVCV